MASAPYMPVYVGDILSNQDCIALTLPAFGAWCKTLFIMWRAEEPTLTKPSVEAWGRAWGAYPDCEPEALLAELHTVADVTEHGDGSVSIHSGRMEEELEKLKRKREQRRERKKRYDARQKDDGENDEGTRSERPRNASRTNGATGDLPPDPDDVAAYFRKLEAEEREAKKFFDHYAARGWRVGGEDVYDWRALARSWISKIGRFDKDEAGALMTREEALSLWEAKGSPGTFPDALFEVVNEDGKTYFKRKSS